MTSENWGRVQMGGRRSFLSRETPEVKIEEKGWLFPFSSSQSLFEHRRENISQLSPLFLRSLHTVEFKLFVDYENPQFF